MDITANIHAKGLKDTGVTEEVAGQMYRAKGKTYLALCEVTVAETRERADGQRRVDLIMGTFEPVLDDTLEDHLREINRVLHRNRVQVDGQLALDDSLAPSVEDVLAAGNRHKPHPYIASTLSTDDDAICDVCGLKQEVTLHNMPTASPFELIEGGGDEDDAEPTEELAEWEREILEAQEPQDTDPGAA